jgi:ABC-type transport system involved in multi-copper enzyme maturation permease subunit
VIAALRYEWVRITSIRSSYWISATTLVVGTGISTLIAWGLAKTFHDLSMNTSEIPFTAGIVVTQAGLAGAPYIVGFVMAIIGVLAWGHEYRHGMIRATFTAVPSRTAIWLAKYIVTLAWVAVTMVVTFAASTYVGWLYLSKYGVSFTSSEVLRAEGKALLVGLLLVTFVMSATAIMRHQTAALVLLFIWPLVIEPIFRLVFFLVPALNDHMDWLNYLPFRALFRILQVPLLADGSAGGGDGPPAQFITQPLTTIEASLVFGAYAVVVVVASLVLLRRRDA